jgi:O-antigen ligase
MTTAAISMPAPRAAATLERTALVLLFGVVAALQWFPALAYILLTAMFITWAAMRVQERTRPAAPAFFLPLVVYGLLTLVASIFSVDPRESLIDSKQLVLLAMVPAVYDIARGSRAASVVDVVISIGAATAVYGIIQYGLLHYDNLGQRPQGTLSHYMTYSGVVMLILCAAASRVIFGTRARAWPALVMPALVVALVLTFTRNAWIGACVAVGLLLVLKDFRLTALLPVVVAVLFVLAPDSFTSRLTSTFNAQDPANQDRFAMIEIGARMVAADPLTGVGPNMVARVYEQYRPDYAVNQVNPHLHNVPLQIAAERGLPAVAAWGWFVVALIAALFRMFRSSTTTDTTPTTNANEIRERRDRRGSNHHNRMLAAMALASTAGMLAAGLFEYNFGDSEFLMLFLVLITLPFAAARPDAAPART